VRTTRCWVCDARCGETAAMCPSCGSPIREVKDRSLAIILAVFFSFVTWAYTYQRNATLFWTGLTVEVLGLLLVLFSPVFVVLNVAVWITAIVQTASKPTEYYAFYPYDRYS
jgi:hypothetical protein